jgi:hypothetical protein
MTRSPYERIVGAQKVGGGAFRKVNGDKKWPSRAALSLCSPSDLCVEKATYF